ncbi:transcriptional regulator, RpiR family [Pilibacter termitis]|uniref:Transcriptional regulator, RpiR family n=1 Tax=Pilibacter termitis TaxID=263852 RepID=A0A1T4KU40_9ENTE|nr:MurR/RpiR family transcriptional regulator [Pilibacter termitis]SJZ45880.1 transcriptional regulator, RpiR family [Pilibacter termitis]
MDTTSLSETEQYLWDWLQQNTDRVSKLSIVQISEETHVSNSTITRTVKKMGYDGFSEYRQLLKMEKRDLVNNGFSQEINEAIFKNENELRRTINSLSASDLEKCVSLIDQAEKISIFSTGLSSFVGMEMKNKLQLLGKNCRREDDPSYISYYGKKSCKDELIILFSLSGKTPELVQAAQDARKNGAIVMSFTATVPSPIAKLSHVCIPVYKSKMTIFDHEIDVASRLPLNIIARILADAYAIYVNKKG